MGLYQSIRDSLPTQREVRGEDGLCRDYLGECMARELFPYNAIFFGGLLICGAAATILETSHEMDSGVKHEQAVPALVIEAEPTEK